jgi:hypothetical protein
MIVRAMILRRRRNGILILGHEDDARAVFVVMDLRNQL